MSVAICLGVDTHGRAPMRWAREHWHDWGRTEPSLLVVADLLDLPRRLGQTAPEGRAGMRCWRPSRARPSTTWERSR